MKKQDTTMRPGSAVVLLVCLFSMLLSGCRQNQVTASPEATEVAASHANHAAAPATEIAQKIPHYFEDPEAAKPFPKTLDPDTLKSAAAKQAYAAARRIPEVLAQQPCYCFCDKGFGHGSLLHCHIDNHSAD